LSKCRQQTFIEFLRGDFALEREREGYVRVCQVEVVLEEAEPIEARIDRWARFPTEKDWEDSRRL